MQLKEKLIKEIDKLSSKELVELYNLALMLKRQQRVSKKPATERGYLKAQNALKNYKEKLSDKITIEREERL